MLFGKKGAVLCTNCKFRDSANSFKNNQVKIKASITTGDDVQEDYHLFTVECAKCARCNRILFTKMHKFEKLKKEAVEHFTKTYPKSDIKLLTITM